MGIFFPLNWPLETLVLPTAVLSSVAFVLVLYLVHTFFRPPVSFKTAQEQADKDLEHVTRQLEQTAKRLQDCREHESELLDKVLEMAQEHIRGNMTRDEAALLTTDVIGLYDWGYSDRLARICIENLQSAAERAEDAQASHDKIRGLHDEALLQRKELHRYTVQDYRKREYKNRTWHVFFKGVRKFTLRLLLCLYCLSVADASAHVWKQEARMAVSQDETVVDVSYNFFGANTVTVDRDGCQMTFPVDVRSSTDYEFTGDGEVHMRVSKNGNVSPCLEWLSK